MGAAHPVARFCDTYNMMSMFQTLVLSLPTVGPLLLKALIAQDMFLAGTIVLLLGIMTVIGTLISDILLAVVDPRIRYD
jgi:peptide/nickel transport system permease protein